MCPVILLRERQSININEKHEYQSISSHYVNQSISIKYQWMAMNTNQYEYITSIYQSQWIAMNTNQYEYITSIG